MAYDNNNTGIVKETKEALKDVEYRIIDKISIPINHCIFKKKEISINDIKNVASHIQAIKQTQKTIFKKFKELNIIEIKDTALSAKMLSENLLPENTIVICNKDIGMKYKLDIVLENVPDNTNNKTTFIIICISDEK